MAKSPGTVPEKLLTLWPKLKRSYRVLSAGEGARGNYIYF